MANIILFTPRIDLNAQANLNAFMAVCREKLTVFGADLPFEENSWSVTNYINLKAKRSEVRIVFSSWESANDKVPRAMTEPFLSFAKSYMRYQHAMRPTKIVGQRVAALRALEAALLERGDIPNPSTVSHDVLHRAAQLINAKFTAAVAYRVAGQLEMISDLLIENRLVPVLVKWHNPILRPREDSGRVGKEFEEKRQQKLPSPSALDALAKAFRLADEPKDVIATSVAAILCSAPDRINEVLLLQADCEVTQRAAREGQEEYGLRWRPGKGADPMVKWIVRSMADVAKEAVQRIRKITEPARQLAQWYEANPGRLFLPESLENLRQQDRLAFDELAEILFAEGGAIESAKVWCKANGIVSQGSRYSKTVSFEDVERAVVQMLPSDFPIADRDLGLKYSEMLCVVRKNTLHGGRATYRCVLEKVTQAQIYDCLAGEGSKAPWSIFNRLGFFEDDGSAIRITSHQFRHYLNTLAQMGGLSQLDIAKWSGRVDVRQNSVYDHESSRDIVEYVRKISSEEYQPIGPLARLKTATLIPRDEFERLKVPTAHTTEFGYCVHDFTMTPCQIHRDCMNCDEQVCIKGDRVREANIRRQREETRDLLDAARAGQSEGYAGADRWVEHQQLTLRRMDQICAILDNPNVPVGALIQPSGVVQASRIEQAVNRRLGMTNEAPVSAGHEIEALLLPFEKSQEHVDEQNEDGEWSEPAT